MISFNKITSFLVTKGFCVDNVYMSERVVYIDAVSTSKEHRVFLFTPKKTFEADGCAAVQMFEKQSPDLVIDTASSEPTIFSFENSAAMYSSIPFEKKELKRAALQALRLAKCSKTVNVVILLNNYFVHSNGAKVWPFVCPAINGAPRFYPALNVQHVVEQLSHCHDVDVIMKQRMMGSRTLYSDILVRFASAIDTANRRVVAMYDSCGVLDARVKDLELDLEQARARVKSIGTAISASRDAVQRSIQRSLLEETQVQAETLRAKLVESDAECRRKYLELERVCFENNVFVDSILKNIENIS
jgi:hypothetical protein